MFLNDSLLKPVLPPPHGDGVPCSTGGLRVSPSAARQGLALRPCGCQVPKSWEETHCPAWVRKWVLGDPAVGTSRAAFPLWSGPSAAPAKGKQVEPFVSLRTFCVTQGSSAQPPHRDLLSPQCQSVLGVPRLLWRGSSGGLSLASLSGVAGGPGLGHEPPSVG